MKFEKYTLFELRALAAALVGLTVAIALYIREILPTAPSPKHFLISCSIFLIYMQFLIL
ncbi:hypothetical protein [Nostoc sp. NMS8]|uniref:hypothetical protein n=1 Tax=Nostoc sp. NMS8 TaxID=2815392 RepID=UPI0025D02A7A|nr:hypothetical protein [Nostoc sp. NMS8]MBN3957315.1 hypothetical protein [Nostoc sp. NMS8]